MQAHACVHVKAHICICVRILVVPLPRELWSLPYRRTLTLPYRFLIPVPVLHRVIFIMLQYCIIVALLKQHVTLTSVPLASFDLFFFPFPIVGIIVFILSFVLGWTNFNFLFFFGIANVLLDIGKGLTSWLEKIWREDLGWIPSENHWFIIGSFEHCCKNIKRGS